MAITLSPSRVKPEGRQLEDYCGCHQLGPSEEGGMKEKKTRQDIDYIRERISPCNLSSRFDDIQSALSILDLLTLH